MILLSVINHCNSNNKKQSEGGMKVRINHCMFKHIQALGLREPTEYLEVNLNKVLMKAG